MIKKTKWNVFSMLEEAKKYTCRKKFKKESSSCYGLASKIGMFDVFTEHMTRMIKKKGYWTKDIIIDISLKYQHRVDFHKRDSDAYRAAQRLNILDDVCSHMIKPPPKIYWTEEKIRSVALRYESKIKFQTENSGAYAAARKLGIVTSICEHMTIKNHITKKDSIGRICTKCKLFKLRLMMSSSNKTISKMGTICKECNSKRSIERIKNNPGKHNAHTANRRAMHKKAMPPWITSDHKKLMTDKYKHAKYLTKKTGIIYEVDHIVPIRSKIVCGLHLPWNLRVITRTENRNKSNKILHHV